MNLEHGNYSLQKMLVEKFNEEFSNTVLPVTIFVGVEIVIGFFGNLLILYVFLFRYHACNFRYFVLCLALTDFLSTVTAMPGEVLTQLNWYNFQWRKLCKAKSFFNMFTAMSEAICLLTIAIDRYRKVCTPYGWQIRPQTAIILCGVTFFIASIIASPVPFLWGTRKVQRAYQNVTITVTICEKDEYYAYSHHVFEYATAVYVIFSVLLTFMFVLYIFVARKLMFQEHVISSKMKMPSPQLSSSDEHSGSHSNIAFDAGKSKSKAELSDTGYSSGPVTELKAYKGHVSSDGGLTTDDEEPQIHKLSEISAQQPSNQHEKKKQMKRKSQKQSLYIKTGGRIRKKTIIMFVLTLTFIITTVCYLTLLSLIADDQEDVLQEMSDTGRAVYFFFFRLFFINHVINPLVYGTLDPHFKKEMEKFKNFLCRCSK